MRLSAIRVTNHSRLADLSIRVGKHLVMVGPNDVGKSSLLRCLDLLLGASNAQLYQRITPEDFRDAEQPFIVEADLCGLQPADDALFPDEPDVDPAAEEALLTVRLTASLDGSENPSIERTAPGGGTGRQLSRDQLRGIGWRFLGATAQTRDLRDDRRTAVDDLLQTLELGDEKNDFAGIIGKLQQQLAESATLENLRKTLAEQLSKALPERIAKDDLAFVSGAIADDDVLSDVRLRVMKNGSQRTLGQQSDGTRALYAIALYDLVSSSANVVCIDEPEIHLHPTSQRTLARLLQGSKSQKIVATHSADIVGAFDPDCIVAVRGGGVLVQPSADFLTKDERLTVEWWMRDKLEPLTARRVVAVEGISDRIILGRAAEVTDRSLDRRGVSVVETGGAGNMSAVIKVFGKAGFDIPLSILIDADARAKTAELLGIDESELNQHSCWVSDPDLEAEYVGALGGAVVWQALCDSPHFTPNELGNGAKSGEGGVRTDADVMAFCRRSKYKVRAAMTVAPLIESSTALALRSINSLLAEL